MDEIANPDTLAGLEHALDETGRQEQLDMLTRIAERVGHYRSQLVIAGIDPELADDLTKQYHAFLFSPSPLARFLA